MFLSASAMAHLLLRPSHLNYAQLRATLQVWQQMQGGMKSLPLALRQLKHLEALLRLLLRLLQTGMLHQPQPQLLPVLVAIGMLHPLLPRELISLEPSTKLLLRWRSLC